MPSQTAVCVCHCTGGMGGMSGGGGMGRGGRFGGGGGGGKGGADNYESQTGHSVHMRGLPFQASEDDIMEVSVYSGTDNLTSDTYI